MTSALGWRALGARGLAAAGGPLEQDRAGARALRLLRTCAPRNLFVYLRTPLTGWTEARSKT